MPRITPALAAVLVAAIGVAGRGQGDGLSAMAEAERAFARMSVTLGQREAFIEFFAEDGVVFNPGPVKAKEFYRQRPPTPQPQARVLDWEPAAGDIADSQDLGFSTGPFAVQEAAGGRRLAGGWFFSVWKRQASGEWRVLVDLGVPSGDVVPLRPRTMARVTPPGAAGAAAAPGETPLETVRRLDGALADRLRDGDVAGYLALTVDQTRVYRAGGAPAVGPAEIRALLEKGPRPTFRPVAAGISEAKDFAYVYGTFEVPPVEGKPAQPGGFLRVWRRIPRGWVLMAEVLS